LLVLVEETQRYDSLKKVLSLSVFSNVRLSYLAYNRGLKIPEHHNQVFSVRAAMHAASILIRSESFGQSCDFVAILEEIADPRIIAEGVAILIVELSHYIRRFIRKKFSKFTFHLSFQVCHTGVCLL